MHSYSHSSFDGLIGVARADITPPVEIYSRNWGAALHDVAESIHRPFTATVLTVQGAPGAAPLVLGALDLGWWRTAEDEWALRGPLLEALQLDDARVMLNLSHTHAGPSMCRADSGKPGGRLIAPYLQSIGEALVRIAREALAGAVPGTLDWHTGWSGLAANRDLPDTEKPRYICGFNPAGQPDGTLLVGRALNAAGKPLATVVNYACHPTVLAWQNRALSPDFPAAMREVVEGHTGAPCLFLQGASGELAPREQYTGDSAVPDAHGQALGFAVLSTLGEMLPPWRKLMFRGAVESGAPLALWQTSPREAAPRLEARRIEVDLELKDMPTAAELEATLAAADESDEPGRVRAERLRRAWRVRQSVGDGKSTRVPVWLWQVGESIFVGHCNEAYSTLQTALRAAFAPRSVVVMNLVNGSTGYLPPADLYGEDLYPVWQTPFAAGGLERLIDGAHAAIAAAL